MHSPPHGAQGGLPEFQDPISPYRPARPTPGGDPLLWKKVERSRPAGHDCADNTALRRDIGGFRDARQNAAILRFRSSSKVTKHGLGIERTRKSALMEMFRPIIGGCQQHKRKSWLTAKLDSKTGGHLGVKGDIGFPGNP